MNKKQVREEFGDAIAEYIAEKIKEREWKYSSKDYNSFIKGDGKRFGIKLIDKFVKEFMFQ